MTQTQREKALALADKVWPHGELVPSQWRNAAADLIEAALREAFNAGISSGIGNPDPDYDGHKQISAPKADIAKRQRQKRGD